jgi:hypothetical protein
VDHSLRLALGTNLRPCLRSKEREEKRKKRREGKGRRKEGKNFENQRPWADNVSQVVKHLPSK